jgi:hypothetical protein
VRLATLDPEQRQPAAGRDRPAPLRAGQVGVDDAAIVALHDGERLAGESRGPGERAAERDGIAGCREHVRHDGEAQDDDDAHTLHGRDLPRRAAGKRGATA